MKLLVITQKVNKNDSNLGFFHEWLLRLAKKVEKLTIICLEKGDYDLPKNAVVLSLGKEAGVPRWQYIKNFYYYIFKYRHEYDGVFVHMNPEYCILGGVLWRLWHKKILLWYTHKAVNWRLRLGTLFANRIFTASKESFRLQSKKVEVTHHGIPVDFFAHQPENVLAEQLCLLAVGRNSPSKDFATVINAVQELKNKKYLPPIKFAIESNKIYSEIPEIYHNCHILVHTSRTGSMDKVVLEALAAGRVVATSSEAYTYLAEGELKGVVFSFPVGDYQELAKTVEKIYLSGILKTLPIQRGIDYVSQNHNLDNVIDKIVNYFLCQNCQ